jgi:hypothetical protein
LYDKDQKLLSDQAFPLGAEWYRFVLLRTGTCEAVKLREHPKALITKLLDLLRFSMVKYDPKGGVAMLITSVW